MGQLGKAMARVDIPGGTVPATPIRGPEVRSPAALTALLRERARELGFDLAGVCPAVEPAGITRFHKWLAEGYGGQMHYLEARSEAHCHPRYVLDGVRSLLILTMNYQTQAPVEKVPSGAGRVSRYAWGLDYHDHIRKALNELAKALIDAAPGEVVRGVVDSAPLLEREFAQLAGLGWIGKNTLLLNRATGSYFFLAALLTSAELEYDAPQETAHCGTCTACLDACPTGAFVAPYVLDARRCISYLTIELREPIPHELRPQMQDWVFGCDICQDVCPWNRFAPISDAPTFQPREGNNPLDLCELFSLDEDSFRARFRKTPLWRPKRRGLLRNAAIALGNRRDVATIAALELGLNDSEPLVRGASAWALGQFARQDTRDLLRTRQQIETDPSVRKEIDLALQ